MSGVQRQDSSTMGIGPTFCLTHAMLLMAEDRRAARSASILQGWLHHVEVADTMSKTKRGRPK